MAGSQEMARRLLAGDRAALARLISWAENADPRYPAVLAEIYPEVGRAWRIGITGPPGCGKSTLTNAMIEHLRQREVEVGVLAIDPSSPFTGGALLGDRIRMEERTAYDVVAAADTVIVVLCPGAGDGIQAMKAGILEVADVLVVNKSDLSGADQLMLDLEDSLRLRDIRRSGRDREWDVPVVACSALHGRGIDQVLAAIDAHREHLEQGDLDGVRRTKRIAQVRRVVGERLDEALWGAAGNTERVDSLLGKSITPYDVAEEILTSVLRGLET